MNTDHLACGGCRMASHWQRGGILGLSRTVDKQDGRLDQMIILRVTKLSMRYENLHFCLFSAYDSGSMSTLFCMEW